MTKKLIFLLCILFNLHLCVGQIKIINSKTKIPVSYATVSFGNGNGIFADDEGVFVFNKKLYPDIDSLFISALGYKNLNITSTTIEDQLLLQPQIDQLDEVRLSYKPNRPFETEELKPYLDDDYFNCWLPTIESEIAVYFPNEEKSLSKIELVKFPIAVESKDWKKRKKKNSDKKKFSTLFKVKFYKNENGQPGEVLSYETIVYKATEKDGDFHELNVSENSIFMPKEGVFVSLQVLGYTDIKGKLLPNKKYKEIKGQAGIVKIPTNFRPLLPFTNEIQPHRTFIKRVFINGNDWIQFKDNNGFKSTLLDKGYYNYGIGLTLKIYQDE